MEINLHQSLCEIIPDLKIGVIRYKDITIGDSPQMLKGRLQLFQESIFFDIEDKNVNDLNEIKEWRTIFKMLGKDPNRYRHSAESLYRRIKKQNYLPTMNSAADVNNFFSLKYRIPLGIYDMASIKGDVLLRKGETDDQYEGLNNRVNKLENILVAADAIGPFGSPFVDSKRTAVTHHTKNALQMIFLSPSLEENDAEKLIESLASMFTHINGGDAETSIIKCL